MYYEDFTPGQVLATGERTVTVEDLDRFLELIRLNNPIFLSDQGARQAGHPSRLVPGPMQFSLAMGLCQEAGLFDHVFAVIGFEQMLFRRTVHPGDTLRLQARVRDKRSTAKPQRGLVELELRLLNQQDQEVMTSLGRYLMRRRA